MSARRGDLILTLFFTVLCLALWYLPSGFEQRLPENALQVKARVENTDNAHLRRYGMILEGEQRLELTVLEGGFKGQKFWADNILLGKLELDKFFSPGDTALAVLSLSNGQVVSVVAQDHYRLEVEALLLGLFALFLLVFAGFTGLKALVSFMFTAMLLWKFLIPFYLKGYDPIYLTLAALTLLLAAVLFLVGGLNRRSLCAYLGSLLGMGLTCLLSLYFSKAFYLHGAIKPYAETLLYTGYAHLEITRLFLATIFLGSSGAVMDLAMDVASSLEEVSAHNQDLGFWRLLGSGLRVGRAVVGTMTTTLLLAYSGSMVALLMVFMAQGVPLANVFNLGHVSAEIMNILVGSFGMVSVAPFTALIGAWLLSSRRCAEKPAH